MTREKPTDASKLIYYGQNTIQLMLVWTKILGSEFSLTFPTIDDTTTEWVKIGPGSHIYEIDISRCFAI